MNKVFILICLLIVTNLWAQRPDVETLNWNGTEVLWLKNDTFPTFSMQVYFYAGAAQDPKNKEGVTELMFDQLTAGTTTYSQQEILDILEFYGVSYGSSVTHEYTNFSLTGLMSNAQPALKMVCHLFNRATFPKEELNKNKGRYLNFMENMVANHGKLADRIFRKMTLEGTKFARPTEGTMQSLKRIQSDDLIKMAKFFNHKVKKKIYIKGPKGINDFEKIITKDCQWGSETYVQNRFKFDPIKPRIDKTVYLASVPRANQAQIRVGRYLDGKEARWGANLMSLAGSYLGGGFTSELIQILRVKHGLIYSGSAVISGQKDYGRTVVATQTRNEAVTKVLEEINSIITSNKEKVDSEKLVHFKRYLKGNFLLGLESSEAMLSRFMIYEHSGDSIDDIFDFPKEIEAIKPQELGRVIGDAFGPSKTKVLVVGDSSLYSELTKAGYKVIKLDYKSFL